MCACVIPRSQDSVTIERVKEFCRYMLGGTTDDDDNPHMPTYVFFFTDFPMVGKEVDKHTLAHTTAAVLVRELNLGTNRLHRTVEIETGYHIP
ncbi:hypothetical protein PoB_001201300 [Plakobranchus ocellatus]|uniref:Uncharacterized protein n=1 Tax=Plakobranchus ocellatus TaxID=259542 RepID=A0AAV3YTD0_9GAST|nr:hypothetical protein PoB_001201300 [Plakobranchus ocellatus]